MLSRKSILIVDADAYLAGIYARRFEQGRWKVFVAESGEEAKKIMGKRRPDAVLVDIETIPEALEFIREIHRNPKTAGTAIVVLTNLGDRQAIEEAETAGADSYLLKAHFVPSEVMAKVEHLVSDREE
jgi:two-component system alkaline phosphatase synthesis response regulator PhoP